MRKIDIIYQKDGFSVKGRFFPKQWLYDEYVAKGRGAGEVADEIGVNRDLFFKICKFYGLSKNKDSKIQYNDGIIIIKGRPVNLGELSEYYQEHSVKETQAHFNISKRQWEKLTLQRLVQKSWNEKMAVRKKTMLEKYGVEHALQSQEIKKKRDETCLRHWGDKNPTASQSWQNTQKTKNGVAFPHLAHVNNIKIWEDDQLFVQYIKEKKKTCIEISLFFNVDPTTIRERVHSLNLEGDVKWKGGQSHYEEDIYNTLVNEFQINKKKIMRHVRSNIFPQKDDHRELDFYLPKYKLGIEFNGDYWHSDAVEKYQDHQGRSRYHQQKSLDAEQMGIFIFHIFEYEWTNPVARENIKNRLKSLLVLDTMKIPARKCIIKEVSKKEKKAFFDINHIQGNDRSTMAFGLYYQKELVCCMSFVKPKTKYSWELSRFCSKHSTIIQGGASKLFTFFIKNYTQKGDVIVSYNDITKTKGSLYQILGFTLKSINPPNYIWMNFQTKEIRTRYQEQKGGEAKRMHEQGFHRICDCGTKTWVYVC